MRIRTIKPEFWSHPVLAALPDEVRLCALGLLNIADDEGYFLANPALVRSALWPLDESSTKVRRILDELSRVGYIGLQEHPSHGQIGLIINFTKHQRVDRPSPSRIKAYYDSTNARRTLDERSCQDQGSGIRDQGAREGSALALLKSFHLNTKPEPLDEWRNLANLDADCHDTPEILAFLEWAITAARAAGRTIEYARHCLPEAAEWRNGMRLAKGFGKAKQVAV